MSPRQSSRLRHDEYAGEWVLVADRSQLLAIGSRVYSGLSPRGSLDLIGRQILLPRLLPTLAGDDDGRIRYDTFDQRRWRSRLVPIHSPRTGTLIAVLGVYVPAEKELPERPLVGAWEWRVTPPGPDQVMRTWWSPTLFDVYGIPYPKDRPRSEWSWEGPQWLDELISPDDRPAIRRGLDEFMHAATDRLISMIYNVTNCDGEQHRLRLAGRSYVNEPGPDQYFRGTSMRVDHLEANTPAASNPYINALLGISADPVCAIDVEYEHAYMTSADFSKRLGLVDLPADRHLPRITHPDDLDVLRTLLREAGQTSATAGPTTIRMAAADGGWQTIEIVARSVRLTEDDDEPHHVICRMTVA